MIRKIFQTKRQLISFLLISAFVTAPYIFLTLTDAIKNENGLIMILPFLSGLPWVLFYFLLPFDIPGFTSAGIPDQAGNLFISVPHLILFMLPVYLNIYIAVRLIMKADIKNNEEKG